MQQGNRSVVNQPANECNNSQNRRSAGLRDISRQVINTIKDSRFPISYKSLADTVTKANLEDILAEVQRRCPDNSSASNSSS